MMKRIKRFNKNKFSTTVFFKIYETCCKSHAWSNPAHPLSPILNRYNPNYGLKIYVPDPTSCGKKWYTHVTNTSCFFKVTGLSYLARVL